MVRARPLDPWKSGEQGFTLLANQIPVAHSPLKYSRVKFLSEEKKENEMS